MRRPVLRFGQSTEQIGQRPAFGTPCTHVSVDGKTVRPVQDDGEDGGSTAGGDICGPSLSFLAFRNISRFLS